VHTLLVRLQHRPAALNWVAASHLERFRLPAPLMAAAQGGVLSADGPGEIANSNL
jgi:hypothetical protein